MVAVAGVYGCGGGSDTAENTPATGLSAACPIRTNCTETPDAPGSGTQGDTTAPSAPTGLSANASSPVQINLSWTASTDNVSVTGYRVYRNGTLLATLGNVVTYQNTGLTASTTYSYTVQAFDAAGNASAQSTAVIKTTPAVADTVAPSIPAGLVATAVSASRINLSWSASTDNVAVTGYRVFRNGALLLSLGNVNAYQDSSLGAGTTYVYTVRAFDAAGNTSGASAPAGATTTATLDTTPPTTPTGLAANAVAPSQIDLNWSASTDNDSVADYRVYRDGALIAIVTTNTHQDTNLALSTTYTYNVDARDPSGNVSALSLAATETTGSVPDTTAPTVPTGLSANAVSPSQINLSWSAALDNVGVTGYRVFRNSTLIATVGNVTTYQSTGLASSTTYTYRVRALDAAGNVSNQSSSASATTQAAPDIAAPTTPTGLTATAISSSRIGLSWSASTDNVAVTGYRVYRNDVFLATLGNVTTYESVGLSAATLYSYRVDAIDAVGNASSPSPAATASTLAANTATLAWDAVVHPGLAGYRIYFGTASGTYAQAPGNGVSVASSATTHTVTGLSSGTRYYFAVTAFDALNNESVFSNEVFKDIP